MANRQRQVRPPYRPQYGTPSARQRAKTPPRFAVELPSDIPWRVIAAVVVGLALVAGARQAVLITEIKVGKGIESEQIPNTVRAIMEEDWRQGSTLTLDADKLEGELLKAKPQLKSVEVGRDGLRSISITGTLKSPAVGWSSGGQSYLLDRDGTAIGPLLDRAGMPVVIDGSNLPVKVGQRVASPRFVSFARGVPEGFSRLGLTFKAMRVQETTYDLTAETARGYRVIYDTSRSLAQQNADLKVVLANLRSQGKTPVEYIDLRIAGKAYYR